MMLESACSSALLLLLGMHGQGSWQAKLL